jgi:hypothetical protein
MSCDLTLSFQEEKQQQVTRRGSVISYIQNEERRLLNLNLQKSTFKILAEHCALR